MRVLDHVETPIENRNARYWAATDIVRNNYLPADSHGHWRAEKKNALRTRSRAWWARVPPYKTHRLHKSLIKKPAEAGFFKT
jgi:hypothetical protein